MTINEADLIPFLLRAKRASYASGNAPSTPVASSRQASHDLAYQEGPWTYLDTYLGGFSFIGEEAVWKDGRPAWGMNYYGTMTTNAADPIPEGFFDFLKHALREVSVEAPYRGPAFLEEGRFTYRCHWEGSPSRYRGEESISCDGQVIYTLDFHGGVISG